MPLPRLVLLVLCALLVLAAPAAAKPATRTYALPATATNPEGIAADQRTRTFYVTTVGDGAVYRGVQGADGPLELFLPGGQDGRTSAAGIKVDEKRRLLVIAGGPTGAVFVYDLATRALVNRIDLGGQFVNDVTILKNGDVYATESGDVDPGVFRIPAATVAGASDAFEPIDVSPPVAPAPGFNLNGIAAAQNGKYVLVVQSNTGRLFRIDTRTRVTTEVPVAGGPLTNGDGILLQGRTLYVVRNRNQEIAAVRLRGDLSSGRVVARLTDPTFEDPTTVARLGGRLLVVNAEFFRAPTPPFTVSEVRLP
jgi:Cu-Zn family superoxide dismutase